MEYVYLTPKKINKFNTTCEKIYIRDIYSIFPKEYETIIGNICIRYYDKNEAVYDVIHLGEIIDKISSKFPNVYIDFLAKEDVIIYFDNNKKDRTKYLRVFFTSIVVLMGSIMGIMNFHADVNMLSSQTTMVAGITNNAQRYLPYFQIPYSIGIGIGVALFFNKFIPNYSKNEPSPLDLKVISLNKEIENQLRKK